VAPLNSSGTSLPPPTGESTIPTVVTDLIQPNILFGWESDEAREMHSKAVRSVLHFFNISNASSDDIVFLYQVQTHGFKISLIRAEAAGWKCAAAIKALRGLMDGGGVAPSRHPIVPLDW
jgi:hypothetical protein